MNVDAKRAEGPKTRTLGTKTAIAVLGVVTLALALLGVTGVLSSNAKRYLLQILLYVALGEAWNLLSGFGGMTSLGQQLYVGLAGYAVAIVTSTYGMGLGMGLFAGVVACVVSALVLSQVLFRMRGMYFAIGTWVIAEAMEKLFLNWRFVNQGSGMSVRLDPYPKVDELYLLALAVALVSLVVVCVVLRSKLGLGLLAMRDDVVAASSVGIDLRRTRLCVYIIAAALAAMAGGLFFTNKGTIYPDSAFSVGWTVSVVFICVVGGSGTVLGPVAGSVVYVLLQEYLAHWPGWSNIIFGVITLVIIFFMPSGLMGLIQRLTGLGSLAARQAGSDTVSP